MCPKGVADRVNLGLIPCSEDGWPVACAALKTSGGILHVHSNFETKIVQSGDNSQYSNAEDSKKAQKRKQWARLADKVSLKLNNLVCNAHPGTHWKVTVLHIEHVKSYAPHVDHVVIDLKCSPD